MKGQTEEFGIDEGQVLTLSPDGARNEVKAANSDFCPDASHVWCVCHILNLVVGDAVFLKR